MDRLFSRQEGGRATTCIIPEVPPPSPRSPPRGGESETRQNNVIMATTRNHSPSSSLGQGLREAVPPESLLPKMNQS